jgi:hypothetical protein
MTAAIEPWSWTLFQLTLILYGYMQAHYARLIFPIPLISSSAHREVFKASLLPTYHLIFYFRLPKDQTTCSVRWMQMTLSSLATNSL